MPNWRSAVNQSAFGYNIRQVVNRLLHLHSPFRIFFISGLLTLAALFGAYAWLGPAGVLTAVILIGVEVMFSFENAIINAKVLSGLSRFWRTMFLTVGIMIAIFGMRIVFPIVVVALTSGLNWGAVINMALFDPRQYAHALEKSHIAIAAFGGMFLTMLFLHFFFSTRRKYLWIKFIEGPLQDVSRPWSYIVLAVAVLLTISFLPGNPEPFKTAEAGLVGMLTYVIIHGIIWLLGKRQRRSGSSRRLKTGLAGLAGFLYLEILDASFSFDSVIGAFAITNSVPMIALGLGIGAVWVRSLTVFMVRRRTLNAYRYIEHGAHYTVGILAAVMLGGIFVDVPQYIAGGGGILLISASVMASLIAAAQPRAAARAG